MTTPQYTDPYDGGLLCAHCFRRKDEHRPVHAAVDVPAGPTLVCPTSVFFHRIERSRASAAAQRAEESR